MINGTKMLYQCINYMVNNNRSTYDSIMTIVAFLASRIGVEYACTSKLSKGEYVFLDVYCDHKLLLNEPGDYFTPVLEALGVIPPLSQDKLNEEIYKLQDEFTLQKQTKPSIHLILPHHTAKLMINAFSIFNNDAIYVVIEPDLLEYRICLLTAKLNNIPAMVLNVHPDIYDISLASANWDYANNWDGPSYNRLEMRNK